MKSLLLIPLFFGCFTTGFGQQKTTGNKTKWVDLAATAGRSKGTVAASYVYAWKIGRKQQWDIGLGARLTSTFGEKVDFITAPASLSRSNSIPFLIVFAGQKTENWDTLTVQRPFTNSLNLTANFGYHFNSKWNAGFNIDLIGFTVGRNSSAILTSNGVTRTESKAKPAVFNALLTGDLDYGNLNSEFFVQYHFNDRWSVRAVYQFIFTEYKTTTIRQVAPDGTMVDRFRNKANNLGLGLSYNL
jgi:hypothetical protein